MKTIAIRRSVLADMLDRIRQDLAARDPPEEIERRLAGFPDLRHPEQALFAYNQIGWPALEPLRECKHGDARPPELPQLRGSVCSTAVPRARSTSLKPSGSRER